MNRDVKLPGFVVFAVAMVWPALAFAQQPPPTAPVTPKTLQTDPEACAQGHATVGQGGGVDARRRPGENLSDKLAQSNGVICPPPGVDPEIHEPTPPGGSIKVIPPPGTPGGNPGVQPK